MKKEIRVVDKERKIMQCTTVDERYYAIPQINKETGLPCYKFFPSVTYITKFYPKGKFFEEWLRKMGNEAETIKQLAGEKGSKIHQAISLLLENKSISIEQTFVSNLTGQPEELTIEEWSAVLSFSNWFRMVKPVVKTKDTVVINEKIGYAGTLDLDCEIDGKPYIIDFKTSKEIYPSFELQLSAYKQTPGNEDKNVAILQLGYTRNKQGFKWTPVENKFRLFLAVYEIFLNETQDIKPKQIELPMTISLGLENEQY